jgi:nucleotide-binding universal stress UspA family protein
MIGHAKAVAAAFEVGVVLVSVIETDGARAQAIDPLAWEIRRREVSAQLAKSAREFSTEDCEIGTMVLEGQRADQICNCATKGAHDIVVMSRGLGEERWLTSKVAHGLMTSNVGAILLVPAGSAAMEAEGYRRIIVPLDGSALAESAIPKAARLARRHGSELVFCHVAPEPVLTEIGPTDPKTVKLKEQIAQHNRRIGQGYLNRIKDSLKSGGVPVSTRLIIGGDARRMLVEAIAEESADIVVMASHGKSGHADVAAGDVADFVLNRSAVPVLIVRQVASRKDDHIFRDANPEGVRHPADLVK